MASAVAEKARRGGGGPLNKAVADAAPPWLYVILMVTPPGASRKPAADLPYLRSRSTVGALGAIRVPHDADPIVLNVVAQLSAARAVLSFQTSTHCPCRGKQ